MLLHASCFSILIDNFEIWYAGFCCFFIILCSIPLSSLVCLKWYVFRFVVLLSGLRNIFDAFCVTNGLQSCGHFINPRWPPSAIKFSVEMDTLRPHFMASDIRLTASPCQNPESASSFMGRLRVRLAKFYGFLHVFSLVSVSVISDTEMYKNRPTALAPSYAIAPDASTQCVCVWRPDGLS